MKVIKAPGAFDFKDLTVFLAGSIEMGKAADWQTKVTNALSKEKVIFFNPRRSDWDASWKQDIENQQFKEQVNWELDGLTNCDMVVFYFDPSTMSPISLMELGLFAEKKDVIVCCPEGYWRKGNVDIVCERYNIKQAEDLDDLIEILRVQIGFYS